MCTWLCPGLAKAGFGAGTKPTARLPVPALIVNLRAHRATSGVGNRPVYVPRPGGGDDGDRVQVRAFGNAGESPVEVELRHLGVGAAAMAGRERGRPARRPAEGEPRPRLHHRGLPACARDG
jgi:hypothetical protein